MASMVCAKWSHGLRIGMATAFCDVMVTWSPTSSSVSRREKPEGAGSGRVGAGVTLRDSSE